MVLKQGLLTAGLVLVFLCVLALADYLVQLNRTEGSVAPGTEAQIGGEFSLVDQSGKPVTGADFADKHKLIFFGFTHCPDVCPTTLSKMSKLLERLGSDSNQLYPIFITVDPERDTPERLRQYSKAFHSSIIYLTGSSKEVEAVLKAWKATRAKIASADDMGVYSMNHSSALYLMAPDNTLVTSYKWEIPTKNMENSILTELKR